MRIASLSTGIKKYHADFFSMLGTVIILAIPTVTIGTLLHELGHGIAVILFVDPSSIVNINLHGYMTAGFWVQFWWQDFILGISGIAASLICAAITWKLVLPRIKKDNAYLRLFFIIFILYQVILGPLYAAAAIFQYFYPYLDTVDISSSAEWALRLVNFPLNLTIIITIAGIAISSVMLVRIFRAFQEDIKKSIEDIIHRSLDKKTAKDGATIFWITVFGIVAVFGSFLHYLKVFWGMYPDYSSIPFNIVALVGTSSLLLLAFYVNRKYIQKNSVTWHGKNRQVLAIGLLCMITLMYVDSIDLTLPHSLSFYSYDNVSDVRYLGTANNIYKMYRFQNSSDIYGLNYMDELGVRRFNTSMLLWSEPLVFLRSYDLDTFIGSYDACLDNDGHLWMFYVKYPESFEAPLQHFSLIVDAWNLSGFDGAYHEPAVHLNVSMPGFTINLNFSMMVKYDETRDVIWNFFISENASLYQTALNLTDFSWSTPSMFSQTYEWSLHTTYVYYLGSVPYVVNKMKRDVFMTFNLDASVDMCIPLNPSGWNRTSMFRITTYPGPAFMANWSDPVYACEYGTVYSAGDRFVRLYYDDRDTWLDIFNSTWAAANMAVRVTKTYAYETSWFTRCGGTGYVLSFGYYDDHVHRAADATLATWNDVTPHVA
nr:hypothetical protein [Candidatus Sigynarchaeota archaeon]